MSQISITINAGSAEELNRILAILGSASGPATTEAKAVAKTAQTTSKAADKTKAEEPKEEPAAAEGPTLEDCKAAMKTFLDANDRDALTELLGRFGIRNISALPTAQYAEFIDACAV